MLIGCSGCGAKKQAVTDNLDNYEKIETVIAWLNPEKQEAFGLWEQSMTCISAVYTDKLPAHPQWELVCNLQTDEELEQGNYYKVELAKKWLKHHELLQDRAPFDLELVRIIETRKAPPSSGDQLVICTEVFMTVSTRVVDKDDQDIQLDRVFTKDLTTGQIVPINDLNVEGYYTVLDDSYRHFLKGKERRFLFSGIKNGTTVFEEEFVIGADQCHIYKVEGTEKIVLK